MEKYNTNVNQLVIEEDLPHNFLAEKLILSFLMTHPEKINSIHDILPIEAFYFQNHRELYRALIFMNKNNWLVNPVTLLSFLQTNGLVTNVGGIDVLLELINTEVSLGYFDEYIRLIKDKFLRRMLIKLGYELINSGYLANLSLPSIIREVESKILELESQLENNQLITNSELLDQIFFELKAKSIKPGLTGLQSGFLDLDLLTQGLQKSDLIIIAGRPSMGKTALALNIANNVLKNNQGAVLFFSLEMSREQIFYRLLSIDTEIDQSRLKSGHLAQTDWAKLIYAIPNLSKVPLFVDDTFNLSINAIRLKIKSIIRNTKNIGLIIIDYIQLIDGTNIKSENRVQEISYITRSLKILAREFHVPIIALSQLSRNVENRIDKRPILSDLRESGSIEQDADLIILLYNNEIYSKLNTQKPKLVELIIAKQRNGPTGLIKLEFNDKYNKFFDVAE